MLCGFVALIVCQYHDLPSQVPPLPFANAEPAKKARRPVGWLGLLYSLLIQIYETMGLHMKTW